VRMSASSQKQKGASESRPDLREDLDDNATLYDKRLENSDIVTKGVRPPKAAANLQVARAAERVLH
jgi:hypothetical protein